MDSFERAVRHVKMPLQASIVSTLCLLRNLAANALNDVVMSGKKIEITPECRATAVALIPEKAVR